MLFFRSLFFGGWGESGDSWWSGGRMLLWWKHQGASMGGWNECWAPWNKKQKLSSLVASIRRVEFLEVFWFEKMVELPVSQKACWLIFVFSTLPGHLDFLFGNGRSNHPERVELIHLPDGDSCWGNLSRLSDCDLEAGLNSCFFCYRAARVGDLWVPWYLKTSYISM